MKYRYPYAGQRFGALEVLYPVATPKGRRWAVRCDCGTEKTCVAGELNRGDANSCGCQAPERNRLAKTKHGMHNTSEYRIWSGIISRCETASNNQYHYYGGRGITICSEWRDSFAAFYADVGPRPGPGYSIDRINNDGNYEPGNVRWATPKEQAANRRVPDRKATHCTRGHEFTPENTYLWRKRRSCRICRINRRMAHRLQLQQGAQH